MKNIVIVLALGLFAFGQAQTFTEQDTLRGSITPERSWWDLNYYHLDIDVNPDDKFISG
ncbi:MAG: M1 family peptidase, partial [Maribacter arcticus]